jgi:PAS domain S-box-containing protein
VDVTDRKRAELALRASESVALRQLAEIEATYETAPVGLAVFDADLRYVRINERLAQINGRSVADHLGRTLAEVVPDLVDQAEKTFRHILATGESLLDQEIVGQTPARPGETRTWVESFVPLRDGDGRVIGINVVCEDVTERKRDEAALRASDRRKDVFLATLAHELRNPLGPIRNAAMLLSDPTANDAASSRARDLIDRQVRTMARLLDDLLDVSRITHGKLNLRVERVALAQILERAIETSRDRVEAGGHSLEVDAPSGLDVEIDADPMRLAQVFSNLINNAAKFMERGGRIRILVNADEHSVEVAVRDQGVGLRPEQLDSIFEMFAQASDDPARSNGGLGIGLALVKGLVDLHTGSIRAESAGPGTGSTFRVTLPRPASGGAAPGSSPEKETNDRVPEGAGEPGRPLRILVVDDLQDAADSLAMMLEMIGHEVRAVYAATDAIALLDDFRPDVVISDLGLPVVSGYELGQRIRARSEDADLLLIALSGYGQSADRQKSAAAGFTHHLVKPVALSILKELLDQAPRRA